ncbi:MAG: urate hydroxylase PuuD [Acidobacteriota bacterium]
MDWNWMLELLFRWAHVVAGVLWIGLLYFFNWVNGPFAATLDGDTKPKVVPQLMPRALYFFRWGAMFTWVTGFLLLALMYYHGNLMTSVEDASTKALAFGLVSMFVGAIVYDQVWKFLKGHAALGVSFVLLAALIWVLAHTGQLGGRALYIHVGAMFGTAMFMNVWMRIWPAQRKIIAAIQGGNAPDGSLVALAGLRSKHNTYMSVPLIFTMISNHYHQIYGRQDAWLFLLGFVAVGWTVTFFIYKKATSAAPTKF